DEEVVVSASASPTEVAEEEKNAASQLAAENGRADGDHSDGEGESDAERRRRRRRRGGRRRLRRDAGAETSFEEPRSSPDLVEILPTPGAEEQAPVAVEATASAPTEARDAVIEQADPPEFAGDTYHRSRSTEVGHEIGIAAPERVVAAANEIRVEG